MFFTNKERDLEQENKVQEKVRSENIQKNNEIYNLINSQQEIIAKQKEEIEINEKYLQELKNSKIKGEEWLLALNNQIEESNTKKNLIIESISVLSIQLQTKEITLEKLQEQLVNINKEIENKKGEFEQIKKEIEIKLIDKENILKEYESIEKLAEQKLQAKIQIFN